MLISKQISKSAWTLSPAESSLAILHTHTFFWQITAYEIRSPLIGQSERKHVQRLIRCDSKNVKAHHESALYLVVKDEVLCFTHDSCQFDFFYNSAQIIIIIRPSPDNTVCERYFFQSIALFHSDILITKMNNLVFFIWKLKKISSTDHSIRSVHT